MGLRNSEMMQVLDLKNVTIFLWLVLRSLVSSLKSLRTSVLLGGGHLLTSTFYISLLFFLNESFSSLNVFFIKSLVVSY